MTETLNYSSPSCKVIEILAPSVLCQSSGSPDRKNPYKDYGDDL